MLRVISHLSGKTPAPEFLVTRFPCTIGRSGKNNIVVDDPSVAEFHAVVEVCGKEFVLRDLGTGSPTAVNGKQISEQIFSNMFEVMIGAVRIEMRLAAASVAVGAEKGAARVLQKPMNIPRQAAVPSKRNTSPGSGLGKYLAAFLGLLVMAGLVHMGFKHFLARNPVSLAPGKASIEEVEHFTPPPSAVGEAVLTKAILSPTPKPDTPNERPAGGDGAAADTPPKVELRPTSELDESSLQENTPMLTMTKPPGHVLAAKPPLELLLDDGQDRWVIFGLFIAIWMACTVGIAKIVDPEYRVALGVFRGGLVLLVSVLVVSLAKVGASVVKFNFDMVGSEGFLVGATAFVASATYMLGTIWAISPRLVGSRFGAGTVLVALAISSFVGIRNSSDQDRPPPILRSGVSFTFHHFSAEDRRPQRLFGLVEDKLKKATAVDQGQ